MPFMEIKLLGTYQVTRDSLPITEFVFNKVRGLLAYLVVESNRPHSREVLAALLWPDASQKSALSNLRNALACLRKAIGDGDTNPPYLWITPKTVQFNHSSAYHLDVDNILQVGADIQHPLSHSQSDMDRITTAVDSYRGAFLEGFCIPDSAEFEEWTSLWRERLIRMTLDGLRWLANYYEACGEYAPALAFAQRQVALEPWLEESHRQVMRILALSGQRSAALTHYEHCKHLLFKELGVGPADETQRLYEVISSGALEDLQPKQILPVLGDPPYCGLRFFDEQDAGLFFGREKLVSQLVERLRRMVESGMQQMVIVGASGSGKSSIIRAGVIPVLRKSGWEVLVMTPTASPSKVLQECAAGWVQFLLSPCQIRPPHLLVIDQFEELFSLCREQCERELFLEQIFSLGFPVLMALRADFYGHCAPYPRLRALLSEWQEYIGSMDAAGLRRAIEEPARLAGWELEPGLSDLILHDVGASGDHPPEPGGLPLLEHALLETWQHRRGRLLTLAGYSESGGVRGAIAQTAERIYNCLSPKEQHLARKVFLRLTELGEGMQDTRRRATFVELHALSGEGSVVERLLHRLAEARLLTLGEETAEVAHEALIREWPALQGWLSENRDGLRLHRHLTERAAAWELLGRDEGEFYRGARLAQALEWAEQDENRHEMIPLESEFLQASREGEEHEAFERETQRQHELNAARRIAETERQRAEEREQAAHQLHQEERQAVARELAAYSKSKLATEPDLSLLLAMQAVTVLAEAGLPIVWDVQQAVHDVALTSRLLWRKEDVATNNCVFAPDGKRVYCEIYYDLCNEKVFALNAENGEILFWIQSDGESVGITPDGKYLATENGARACLWDARTGQKVLTIPMPCPENPQSGSFHAVSPDGRYLLVNSDSDTGYLVDLGTWWAAGEPAGVTLDMPMKRIDRCTGNCPCAVFSPDGKTFTTADEADSSVILWDTETCQPLRTFLGHTAWPRIDSFSPDGSRLATCGFDETIRIWEVSSARELMRLYGHTASIHSVFYSPNGKKLASASNDSLVILWDAQSGQRLMDIHPGGPSYSTAFHPDVERLFITTFLGSASMWDISLRGRGELATVPRSCPVNWTAASWDGSLIVESRPDGSVGLLDSTTFHEIACMVVSSVPCGRIYPGLSRDNHHLAVDVKGRISVWNVGTAELLFDRPAEDSWKTQFAFPPAFSPNGTLLATGGYSGKITVWNLVTEQCEWVFPIRLGSPPQYGQFSPDGRYLAVGCWVTTDSMGGLVWIWDLSGASKSPLILNTDKYTFNALCFSPDNKYLACCGNDLVSRIWDVESGEIHLVLSGHTASVYSILYSPDGRYLVTASIDSSVIVWDAQSGAELLCYHLPNGKNTSLAFFTADCQRVVACTHDDCFRLLTFQNFDELLDIVGKRKTRDWKPVERSRYLRHET